MNDDARFPRRIGLLTGGGDAPGLNAVIRAVVKSAANTACECVGLENGFDGRHHPGWRYHPWHDQSRQPISQFD